MQEVILLILANILLANWKVEAVPSSDALIRCWGSRHTVPSVSVQRLTLRNEPTDAVIWPKRPHRPSERLDAGQ